MSKNVDHLQHVKSNVVENGLPKLPQPSVLVEGELAVNYATGFETISLKNASGDVITFSSDNYYNEKKLGSGFTGENSAVTVTEAIEEISIWEKGSGENSAVLKGGNNIASGTSSVAEGYYSKAGGNYSHAEGNTTIASGDSSHAEGNNTIAGGSYSHAEGISSKALGYSSHAEGTGNASGAFSHAEGHATASGDTSHAEGTGNASGAFSHAECTGNASGSYSHAEGHGIASGDTSHAEGNASAYGDVSHAEGSGVASGNYSHAEGTRTSATTYDAHAEGISTLASGDYSHAEGSYTTAVGNSSHAEGLYTEANNQSEHASGQYNISSSASTTFGNSGNTLFSVGNGTDDARHNAFEIRQNGDIYINKDGNTVLLQDEIGNIPIDQVIDSGTSASTNAVSTKAVFDRIAEDEYTWALALNTLERDKVGYAAYNSTTHYINFYANQAESTGSPITSIDATPFIVDGMVDDVRIEDIPGSGTCLVIDFNTESGKQDINIPISDIFDASNYYDKDEVDARDLWVSGTGLNSVVQKGSSGVASGNYAVVEGYQTSAYVYSHSEGYQTQAIGNITHAEGVESYAAGDYTHAEGWHTSAMTNASHSEGVSTYASITSHAEGTYTTASGNSSHAEGQRTIASGYSSHAEGNYSQANAYASHAEGNGTEANGDNSHAEGFSTKTYGWYSHAEGNNTTASGGSSHAEGHDSKSIGDSSHAEGNNTTASGYSSHAEGNNTVASGYYSHAEGDYTSATTYGAHAEGNQTKASGYQSHAEGNQTTASGHQSHTEGYGTLAGGTRSHAEGDYTTASGYASHAEGEYTTASGYVSHAEGRYTEAKNQSEHASGQYNVSSSASAAFGDSGNTLFSVGNGTADNARHNAFEIRQNGDIYINKDGNTVLLQDEIGNIPIDQEITSATSASTNAVSTAAVYNKLGSGFTVSSVTEVIESNERVISNAINDLNDNKLDTSDFTIYSGNVATLIGSGFTSSSITEVMIENEEIVSAALADLDDRKLDASGVTSMVASAISVSSFGSNVVTAMTNYAVAASGSAITTGDTLNQAIGKLENRISGMSYSNVAYGVNAVQNSNTSVSLDGTIPLHVVDTSVAITSLVLSTNPAEGHSCHVILSAASELTVSIPYHSTYRVTPDGQSVELTIPAGGYVEVDFLCANNKVYVRGV